MEKIKYLKNDKEDSSGHMNKITAVDSITIHTMGNRIFASVQLNKYKDSDSKLAGKSPSIDKVRPQTLYTAELDSSLVEFHNMIVDSVAKKHKLSIIEVEGKLQLKSPKELKAEKDKKDGKKLPANSTTK